jgi:hypothetical protein
MKRVLFCIIFLCCSLVFAQKFQVAVSTTRAEVNQRITVQYQFDGGNLPNDVLPKVKNMLVVGGPSVMSGSNTINGVTTNTSQLTYEILFTQAGTFTIPASSVKTKNGKFTCSPITITVVKGRNSKPIFPAGYEGRELFIEMVALKKNVFIGEPIAIDMVVYSIFTNLNIAGVDYPTFDGGWTQDATDAFDGQLTPTSYKGKPYYKTTIRRVWMIPSITGEVEFKPVNAVFQAVVNDPHAGNLQFTYNSKSDPVKFNVVDVPSEKRPVSFLNAMGNFKWNVRFDKKSAKANEPVKATITINGTGNLPTLDAPVLDLGDDFEVFEPKVKNNHKVEIKGINGSKEFEYLIMPRKEGNYVLGPFEFSYFNPETKKFTTLVSDSFDLQIKGIIADTTTTNKKINNGKFDIDKPYKKSDPFFGNPFYYLLLALPFLAGLGMIFFRKRLFFVKKDESIKNLKLAEEKAGKGIIEAGKLLSQQNTSGALTQMSGVFFQYISDKFKTTKNEITRANLDKWLTEPGLKQKATKIMDQLDQFRFAPAAQSDLTHLLNDIKTFIDELGKK